LFINYNTGILSALSNNLLTNKLNFNNLIYFNSKLIDPFNYY